MLAKTSPLAIDRYGHILGIVEGQTGYLVRCETGGRPRVEKYLGAPLIVPWNATPEEVFEKLRTPGVRQLYPVDEHGNEIKGAPVAYLEVTPDDIFQGSDMPHWMRLDRVFDALDRSMAAMESRDLILGEIVKSLLESNTALQSGAVRMLDTANQTINVANGVARPDFDYRKLGEELYDTAKQAQQDTPTEQPSFAVQVLNGGFGEAVLSLVSRWAGIPIAKLDEEGAA